MTMICLLISYLADHAQLARANHPWCRPAGQPVGKHGVQGLLRADAHGGDGVRAGSEVGSLHQGAAPRDFPR